MELQRRALLPAFALAADDRLERAGKGAPAPAMLAWVHDQAMLLAPWQSGDCWCGFLLAEPEASGQLLEFSDLDGGCVSLQLPELEVLEGVLCTDATAELPIVG
jgi:hypothetical protein